MEEKLCPLRKREEELVTQKRTVTIFDKCISDKCGFWCPISNRCGISAIGLKSL